MISGEKIGQFIQYPSQIQGSDLTDLMELQNKYPYCSSIYMLYLKGLAITNDLSFEQQLSKTAIHVQDREHLYKLIHSQGDKLDSTEIEFDKIAEPDNSIETVEIAQIELPKVVSEELEEEAEVELEQTVVQPAESAIDIAEEILITLPNQNTNKQDDQIEEEISAIDLEFTEFALEGLEQGILTHAIDIAFMQAELQQNRAQEASVEIENLETSEEELFSEHRDISESTANFDKEDIVEVRLGKDAEETTARQLSFVEWLKLKNGDPISFERTQDPAVIEENKVALIDSEKKAESKAVIDALLEKFISDQPSISRPVKEFYNPAKNAKQSLEESDDLVTETLAKIYALQKNYPKAITAYEKLSLLYPEKKTFFASRIEKLKEELKKR